jgi:Bacteriophage tail sheath protein
MPEDSYPGVYIEETGGAACSSSSRRRSTAACDRTTMTQDDIDSGRLTCLIGVAPVKPAEFVIFRIGAATCR